MNIWDLPGPSTFIDEIDGAIRSGSSVIARFSSEVPPGLERRLRERLRSDYEWVTVNASRARSDLLAFLHQAICPDISVFEAGSIRELASASSFQGKLIWIEEIAEGVWPEWLSVLRAYSDVSRNLDLLSRTVFIVILSGKDVAREVPEDVALVCCDFRGIVDISDLLVLALWKIPKNIRHREHRALLAHTVAQVAQWDIFLAEQLLDLAPGEMLNPEGTLRRYGQERGWTDETPRCWEAGTVDGPVERPTVHSALLEVSGALRLVRHRVWAAQAAVLLPLVEERRIGLVDRCHSYIDLPSQSKDGRRVDNPLDLDVGQLAWYVDRPNKPYVLRKQARRLRDARNKLAHMEPLNPEQALHRMLLKDP